MEHRCIYSHHLRLRYAPVCVAHTRLLSQVGPVFPFVLQIIPWVLILIGGLANKMSPGFVQPKGVLGSLFHKRLVTCSESIKHSSM
jgi:hypothetical protein